MQKTEALVLGVMRRTGIGKQSGQPYDMAMVYIATPISDSEKPGNKLTAGGYDRKELDADPEAVQAMLAHAKHFPCHMVLSLDARMDERQNLRAVVTDMQRSPDHSKGHEPVAKAAKAA